MADALPRTERAKQLLQTVRHAAMATVNVDGSPHNTPYFFMRDASLKHIYWSSHPHSLHSRNVARTGQVYVVLYEATASGGLYIQADQAHATDGDELETALEVLNEYRTTAGKEAQTTADFSGPDQRLYVATVQHFWVNGSGKDAAGNIQKDQRYEVNARELLG